MLFKGHCLRLLADVPQLNHPLVVTANEVAFHVAVPADTAQLGPAKTYWTGQEWVWE